MVDEMDNMFDDFLPSTTRAFIPALDVYQTADDVIVETALPGIDAKDVNVSVENDVLTIEGKTETQTEVDDKNFYRKEIGEGSFFRTVALPTHVKWDKAEATSKDGMLKIVIPKALGEKARNIAIKIKKS